MIYLPGFDRVYFLGYFVELTSLVSQVHFAKLLSPLCYFLFFFGYVVYRWFLSLCQAHIAKFTFPSHQLHIAKTLRNCQVHFKLWTAYMSFKLPETIIFFLSCPTPLKKIQYAESFAPKNSNWLKKISCFGWHSRTQWFPTVMLFSF